MEIEVNYYDFAGKCMARFAHTAPLAMSFDTQIEYIRQQRDDGNLPKVAGKAGKKFILVVRDGSSLRVILPEAFDGRTQAGRSAKNSEVRDVGTQTEE